MGGNNVMNKEKNVITYKHINGEMWCSIPDFPNHYANKKGDILGARGKLLGKTINRYGYETVSMSYNGKSSTKTVHRLIAKCFIYNNDETKNQIDHVNGIKHDNRVENLEWVSNKENQKRAVLLGLVEHTKGESHHNSKLTEKEVKEIFLSFDTHSALARKYNTTPSNIWDIRMGNTWKETTSKLDNREQINYLKDGVRTLTINEIKKVYVEEGNYQDIAKKYKTSREVVSKIKNDELCTSITRDLTPVKSGLSFDEVKYIYTTNDKTIQELAEKFNVSRGYIENIKNGYMYKKITKNLHKGECYKVNRLTKEQVIYIYTCSKTIKQLSKELNIKETTIRAIRKQQSHYKTTKNLTKGEW